MKVLVIDRDRTALAAFAAVVRSLDHEVYTASDDADALSKMATTIDVVIVDARSCELIRKARERRGVPYPFVLALAKQLRDDELRDAYEAGCDGDIRSPGEAADVRARLSIASRMRTAASGAGPPAKVPTTTPAKVASLRSAGPVTKVASPVELVTHSAAWRTMQTSLANACGTFLTLDAKIGPAEHEAPIDFASGILLANVDAGYEIRVVLAVDKRDARGLAMHLFGEESDELASDVLGELANIAMGSLKTTFGEEGVAFTGGLPVRLSDTERLTYGANSGVIESFCLRAADARVHVRVGIASTKNVLTDVGKLREGMVLAKDLFNARGMLVVLAGTRLSATTADKLRMSLPPQLEVEIAAGSS